MPGDPVIIEAAINGVTSRDRNPNVPIEPAEIADDALACMAAGASVIHNHIDRYGISEAEAADRYLEAWRPVLAERPDALVYPTVHGGVERSYEHLVPLAATGLVRIGIVDPGSVNLGGVDADGVPVGGIVYDNSFDTIGRAFEICSAQRLGPSMAIYEPGFLRTVVAWWRSGRLPPGGMVKLYFSSDRGYMGAPFGLPATPTALDAYLEVLGECDVPWAVSLVGGDLIASDVARLALRRGGHLHLGLEFYNGQRVPRNVELVEEAVALSAELGRKAATPDEAADILALPRQRG
ncbi:MAG: 3-keto-5-aminohexanoate cleavage protein [Acidimicrobiales bacterium]